MGTATIAIRDEDVANMPPTTLSVTADTPVVSPDVADIIESRRATARQQQAAADAAEQAAADIAAKLEGGVVLDGRKWFPVRKPTYQQQFVRMGVVHRAGVLPLVQRYRPETDDADQLAADVIATAFANGALFDLLAALLVEEGTPWSVGGIAENALRFASLTEPDDHATLTDVVLWLVLDFFTQLGPLRGTFLRSLRAPDSNRHAGRNPNSPRAISGLGGDSAATTTSASGTAS